MLLEELRKNVLETAFQMVVDGLAHGAQGNISALDRETGLIAITPSALPYKGMQVEDICVAGWISSQLPASSRPPGRAAKEVETAGAGFAIS